MMRPPRVVVVLNHTCAVKVFGAVAWVGALRYPLVPFSVSAGWLLAVQIPLVVRV